MNPTYSLFQKPLLAIVSLVVIGLGQVAALNAEMYRLVPLGFSVAIFILVLWKLPSGGELKSIGKSLLLVMPLYIYMVVSSLWAPDPNESFRDAIYVVTAVAPCFLFGLLLARRCGLISITRGLVALYLVFAIQALLNWYLRNDPMLFGILSMRSIVANLTCIVAPVFLASYLMRKDWLSLLGLVAVLVFVYLIQSRSALIIVLPSFMFVFFLYKRLFGTSIIFFGLLILTILLGFGSIEIPERFSGERFKLDVSDSVLDELSLPIEKQVDIDRRLAFYVSVRSFSENPFRGIGYSGVWQINRNDYGRDVSAHGIVPGTLSEIGLFGLSLFALIIIRVFVIQKRRLSVERNRSNRFIMNSFFTGFLASIFFGFFHQLIESNFFVMFLGILLAYPSYSFRYVIRTDETISAKSV